VNVVWSLLLQTRVAAHRVIAGCAIAISITHAHAQPASVDAEAEAHRERGVKLLTESPKDYTAAAREFAAAYKLKADPKYLFNLALAQRLGGNCREAIDTYKRYLATDPPSVNANNARIGIERCEETLAAQPRPDDDPKTVLEPPPVGERAERSPAPIRTDERPIWRRDPLATGLVLAGGAATLTGITLNVLARRAASSTFEPGRLDDFERARDRAATYQTTSVIAVGAGAALIAGGAIWFLTHRKTGGTIHATGNGVAVGGRF